MLRSFIIAISLLSIIIIPVYSQSCVPEGISFVIQQDVNDFLINYPECTEIEGSVEFHGSMWDLSPLSNIISIGGDLTFTDCDNLTSFQGLNSLTSVGGKFKMYDCQELTNLNGLSSLNSIGGEMEINQNYNLISLYGTSSLTSIGGQLKIMSNSNMLSLYGINNLTAIEGKILIQNNGDLVSLEELENLDSETISELTIIYNNELKICETQSICNYLLNDLGPATIYGNALGCNSVSEVEEACATVSIDEASFSGDITTSPNPFTTSTTLSYELKYPEKVMLMIYDYLGKQVYQTEENQQQGKQKLKWNADRYADGIYYYRLQVGKQTANGKMMKVK